MGRASRFALSLSGRKGSHAKEQEDYLERRQWTSTTPSTNNLNLSKAERLLGTSNLPVRSSHSYNSLERASLNTKSSYMTLTVSEASADFTDNRMTASTVPVQHYNTPPRFQSLRHRASSNLLGLSEDNDAAAGASITSFNTRDLRLEQSSSTLRSYYDAQKSPLSVSQQTSASAVRDMALRKGLQPVVPVEDNDSTLVESTRTSKARSVASNSKQRRPARLDLSRLFPRARASSGNLFRDDEVFSSPSQMSAASEYFPRSQTGSAPPASNLQMPFQLRTRRSSKSPSVLIKPRPESAIRHAKHDSHISSLRRQPFESPKGNVRRPPKGVQNWFDGLLEEEFDDEVEDEEEPQQQQYIKPPISSHQLQSNDTSKVQDRSSGALKDSGERIPYQSRGDNLRSFVESPSGLKKESQFNAQSTDNRPWTNSTHSSSRHSLANTTKTSSEQQSVDHHSVGPSSQTTLPRSHRYSMKSYITGTSAASKASKLAEVNLHRSSALSLSSDEEEAITTSLPKLRDSINISDLPTDNILIGKARAFEMRPKRRPSEPIPVPFSINEGNNADDATTFHASDSESITTETHSADSRTEGGAHALRDFHGTRNDGAGDIIRPHTSGAHKSSRKISSESEPSGPHKRRSLRNDITEAATFGHSHKLMAVTAEEEILLEMMRSKRAAMAKHSFKEGYRLAIKQEGKKKVAVSRPPNSHTDARPVDATTSVASNALSQDEDALITANSSLGEIMDAFPSPSPTSNRFSLTFRTKSEERSRSPGLSAASSSRHGRSKRYSTLSTMSSNVLSTSGTSATSSSPIPPDDSSESESSITPEDSISEHVSNASTVKRKPGFDRLSVAPLDTSIESLSRTNSPNSIVSSSSRVLPSGQYVPQQASEEFVIRARQSIVADNDTGDLEAVLEAEKLFSDLPTNAELPKPNSSDDDPTLPKARKRHSMRINVDAEPPSAAPESIPPSPRRPSGTKTNKRTSVEYRFTPRITPSPKSSPVSTSFPIMGTSSSAQTNVSNPAKPGRAVTAPTLLQATLSDQFSPGSSGRSNLVAANSTPAPILGRSARPSTPSSSSDTHSMAVVTRAKPRTIDMANFKKAFSVAHNASPGSASQPAEAKRAKRSNRHSSETSRDLVGLAAGSAKNEDVSDRASVSEDVLAAWGNLGGWGSVNPVGVTAGGSAS